MEKAFFTPHVGKLYNADGFLGKKILVVGASFYCNHTNCRHFKDCTNESAMDSSRFNNTCTEYNKIGHLLLSDSPTYELEEGQAYKRFGNAMSKLFCNSTLTWDDFWDRCAFTNYVQFILPHWKTYSKNISPRDLDAFIEVIGILQPDIIIVWGTIVNKPIKSIVIDPNLLIDSEGYLFHVNVDDRCIPVVNSYHPTSSLFYDPDEKRKFKQALECAFAE